MIGQESVRSQLREMIDFNTVPRFLILTGAKGSGKYTLSKWFTKQMKAFLVEPELSVDAVNVPETLCTSSEMQTVCPQPLKTLF